MTRLLVAWLLIGWLLPLVPMVADTLTATCPELHDADTTACTTTHAAGHTASNHCPSCSVPLYMTTPPPAPTACSPGLSHCDDAGYPSRLPDPPYRPPPLS